EPKIGALSGGGRYDHLIGQLGAPEAPAVGIALGLERLIDVIDELGMAPAEVRSTVTAVLVTIFDPPRQAKSLATAVILREAGINCEVFLGTERLATQLRYANRKNIPLALILGPDEVQAGTVVVRNLLSGDQSQVREDDLIDTIKIELVSLSGVRRLAQNR
ncbi:MAG TPA: His/Gly/Thr/Pro-type tRNA ligase C-terminal domain-containing protein, partial [Chloroflexota bacterium]|nr:His/Gly/Thr/Pro-type tRNA ligase C-terminal domain-containing protein [Chloroflexota bacterium]